MTRIRIDDVGRSAEIIEVSLTSYRVILEEGEASFLYVVDTEAAVSELVSGWLVFPEFAFGSLRLPAEVVA